MADGATAQDNPEQSGGNHVADNDANEPSHTGDEDEVAEKDPEGRYYRYQLEHRATQVLLGCADCCVPCRMFHVLQRHLRLVDAHELAHAPKAAGIGSMPAVVTDWYQH